MSERNPYEPPRALSPRRVSSPPPATVFRGPLILLTALTVIAAASFNLAMMIVVLAPFIGAALMFLGIIVALFQRDAGALLSRVLYLGVLLAMLPIGAFTLKLQHHFLDLRMQPLVAAIETYQRQNGHYPTTLDELELSPPRCNAVGGFGPRPLYLPHEGSYSILCMTFGFNHHSYRPLKQRWENWD